MDTYWLTFKSGKTSSFTGYPEQLEKFTQEHNASSDDPIIKAEQL